MNIHLIKTEMYPVIEESEHSEVTKDIPAEFYERWRKAFLEFDFCNEVMRNIAEGDSFENAFSYATKDTREDPL